MNTNTVAKKIDASTYAAMVASGDDEQCGLHGVQDLQTAKAIVSRIARIKDLSKLLRCVAGSRHPHELLVHLMQECSFSSASLREFVSIFNREADGLDFDEEVCAAVEDKYWSVRIHERIQKLDFQRAWELIKKSRASFNDQGVTVASASLHASIALVNALYETLHASGRMQPIDERKEADIPIDVPARGESFRPNVLKCHPGIEFARSLDGVMHGKINARGRKVIAIAGYLNRVRRKKERKKVTARAFAQV